MPLRHHGLIKATITTTSSNHSKRWMGKVFLPTYAVHSFMDDLFAWIAFFFAGEKNVISCPAIRTV